MARLFGPIFGTEGAGIRRLVRTGNGHTLLVRSRSARCTPAHRSEHETGLWGIRLLALALAITPFRQIFAQPRIVLLRRMIGVAAFTYLVIHFCFYVADQKYAVGTVASEIARRFYLTIGFATLLVLLSLAVTSTDGMMRRLRRRWQTLHRLVYLAAIVGTVHYFIQVKLNVYEPTWFAGIIGWLLIYRLLAHWFGVQRASSIWALALLSIGVRNPDRVGRVWLLRNFYRCARRTGVASQFHAAGGAEARLDCHGVRNHRYNPGDAMEGGGEMAQRRANRRGWGGSGATQRGFLKFLPLLGLLALGAVAGCAPTRDAEEIGHRLDAVRTDKVKLEAFLRPFPKGADLHNHLSGAIYAESFLKWAAADGLCIDRRHLALTEPPCRNEMVPATTALDDRNLYDALVTAFSMHDFLPDDETGHDHFFATFEKFAPAEAAREGDMLAEALQRAASDHVVYLELMWSPGMPKARKLGKKSAGPRFRAALQKTHGGRHRQDRRRSEGEHEPARGPRTRHPALCRTGAASTRLRRVRCAISRR